MLPEIQRREAYKAKKERHILYYEENRTAFIHYYGYFLFTSQLSIICQTQFSLPLDVTVTPVNGSSSMWSAAADDCTFKCTWKRASWSLAGWSLYTWMKVKDIFCQNALNGDGLLLMSVRKSEQSRMDAFISWIFMSVKACGDWSVLGNGNIGLLKHNPPFLSD